MRPFAALSLVARLDHSPKTLSIVNLGHDGRGVARWPEGHANAGKTVFVAGALPGETVSVQQTARSRHFDEAKTLEVIQASPDRVEPRCPHFGTCGGCVLQHFAEDRQIEAKQRQLLDNLQRIGHVAPQAVLPPLRGDSWGYRRKGRFSVRRVEKKDKTLVGFREQDPRFVADIGECHVVVPQLGFKVAALGALVGLLACAMPTPAPVGCGAAVGVAAVPREGVSGPGAAAEPGCTTPPDGRFDHALSTVIRSEPMTTGDYPPPDPNFPPPPPGGYPPPPPGYGPPTGYPVPQYGQPGGYPPSQPGAGQPGGLGVRFAARVIDGILVGILSFLLAFFIDMQTNIMVTGLFSGLLTFIYFAWFITMPVWSRMGTFKPVPQRVTMHD